MPTEHSMSSPQLRPAWIRAWQDEVVAGSARPSHLQAVVAGGQARPGPRPGSAELRSPTLSLAALRPDARRS